MNALALKVDPPRYDHAQSHSVPAASASLSGVAPVETGAERAVREISDRFSKLSAEITDVSGRIGDVTRQFEDQTEGLHRVVGVVEQVARGNHAIRQAAEGAQEAASVVRHGLERVTGSVKLGLSAAQTDIEA